MAEAATNRSKKEFDVNQYVRVEVIASLFGVSVRRIQQLTQEGIISTTEVNGRGRKYELGATVQKYITFLSDKAHGKQKTAKEVELKQKKLAAEVALKESQGELHRIRTEIAAGKYIPVEEVKLDYSRFFLTLKKFVLGIPNKLAGRVAGYVEPTEARQLEKELQNEAAKMLKSFVVAGVVPQETEKDEKV